MSREFQIFYAKVLLKESAARRTQGGSFHWWLFHGAQEARRKAATVRHQRELFK